MSKTLDLSKEKLEDIYHTWIQGKSLRQLGRLYNMPHCTIHQALRRMYGDSCCSLKSQGLARVVYQDYGDMDTAMKARDVDGVFLSHSTEDRYSTWQCLDTPSKPILQNLVYEPADEEPKGLSLSTYVLVLGIQKHIILAQMTSIQY